MKVIHARNVQQALPLALDYLFARGVERPSRNGLVLQAPGPVVTVYERPRERVLFWEERDANPFFHFFESLWMLAGREDVAFLVQFVKRMREFSDDGTRFHGAYGKRWRGHFSTPEHGNLARLDQLRIIAENLRRDPTDRRAVLAVWDPESDLGMSGKDLPCNTHAYFQRDPAGALDLVVCCRSNDVVWGCYGANAVHWSYVQEYVAGRIGCPVGTYTQVSANWHGYLATVEPLRELGDVVRDWLDGGRGRWQGDPYEVGTVIPYERNLVDLEPDDWDRELRGLLAWIDGPLNAVVQLKSEFLMNVAVPLYLAHLRHRERNFTAAQEALEKCKATDWKLAAQQWLARRAQAWATAQA